MELHAPELLVVGATVGCHGYLVGRCYYLESFGQGSDGVAMTHPYLTSRLHSVHKRVGAIDMFQDGTAIFAAVGRLYGSSEHV